MDMVLVFWQQDMEVISSSVVETLNGRPSQPKGVRNSLWFRPFSYFDSR